MKKSLIKTVILGVIVFIVSINVSCSQSETENGSTIEKVKKIDEIIGLYSDYEGFNGSVLVAHEGKVIYKKGFGFANMEWDIPNKTNTKFRIASITKQFTAMLIMQLVAENKLDLHQPISTYLPDYPKENGNQITIHHLLTHSSGLGRNHSNNEKKYSKPKAMVNQFAEAALKFKPGERFSYSNDGYTLLGYLIETITEKSYEDVLQDKIFKPLNMKNSGFYKHRPIIKDMSFGYYKSWGNYFDIDYSDESTAYAAGAIYSTVEDLFLWNQSFNTETLLPKKYLDLIFKKHIVDSEEGGYYGYGWEFKEKSIGNTTDKIETVGHSGRISGYRTLYTKIQSSNSAIILLNNTSRAFLNSITIAITGILNDESYDFPLKPLAQFMTKTIEKEGIDKGILFYKEHKGLDGYYVSEQELIVEGYKLLHTGNAKDAATVFKLSTEVFPDKDNPYDSYAEALMALGENEKAIANYKKSLKLNPNNKNAVKMLKKLGVDETNYDLLETDNWGKEVFTFPLRFAKGIDFKGIEEARFPKGWIKEEHSEFWSYAFAWKIDLKKALTVNELEDYMRKYYDGLMVSVNKEEGLVLPKTSANFRKKEDSTFIGKVTAHDSFVTKKLLTLNIKVRQEFCVDTNESIVLFLVSPKEFGHEIWDTLGKVEISRNGCD